MKNSEVIAYLQIAGLAVAGVVAYKIYSKVRDTGASVGAAAKEVAAAAVETTKKVVTEDLNPASDKNIVYSSLPESVQVAAGDVLGGAVNTFYGQNVATEGYPSYSQWVSNFWSGLFGGTQATNPSAVNSQGVALSTAIENTEAAKRKAAKDLTLSEISGGLPSSYNPAIESVLAPDFSGVSARWLN